MSEAFVITAIFNPNSFNRLMSNPIAAMKSYTDIVNAFGAIFKYTFQSEEDMRKAIDEGDLALKIGNTLPPFTMVTKTIRSATMQF